MHLIDGKTLARKIRDEIAEDVQRMKRDPKLAVLLVGNDPASHLYVTLKEKAAAEAGIRLDTRRLPAETTDDELVRIIEGWNADTDVDAILVQLPLPPNHDEKRIIASLDPQKDVDGFHPRNIEKLLAGNPIIVPPVHEGILRLMSTTPVRVNGANVVIIGNSDIFATPLKRLLTTAGASVDVMSPDDLQKTLLAQADVVVIAVGRAAFLHPSMTKDDVVIIDVGTNRLPNGTVIGDTDQASYEKKENVWLTPVPGGVGPMTIAQLLKNVVRLAQARPLF